MSTHQKAVFLFLYSNNEQSGKEIRNNPIYSSIKRNKYLEINLYSQGGKKLVAVETSKILQRKLKT